MTYKELNTELYYIEELFKQIETGLENNFIEDNIPVDKNDKFFIDNDIEELYKKLKELNKKM